MLGDHVRQAGSLVEAGRLRFDFSHFKGLDPEELDEVELRANRRTVENAAVSDRVTSKQEAERIGALAFFGDKYGEQVRVVRIGDYSIELCGGTHTPSAGQVGPLLVIGESSIGSNLRRIEALSGEPPTTTWLAPGVPWQRRGRCCGPAPTRYRSGFGRSRSGPASSRSGSGRCPTGSGPRTPPRWQRRQRRLARGSWWWLSASSIRVRLRALALAVRDRLRSGAVVLGSRHNGKGALVAAVTADLTG